MANRPPVFISYSRKDYYFAESLAFHLVRRGVPAWLDARDLNPGGDWESDLAGALEAAPCVVLIATRASMRSENVASEWRRALALGKRIIIARFGRCELPAELSRCEVEDFRGGFSPALSRLIDRLGNDAAPIPNRPPPLVHWPPWVAAIAVLLLILALLPMSLALAFDVRNQLFANPERRASAIVMAAGMVALAALYVWFFAIAFVRRRMGMTRLVVCLGYFAWVYCYPVAQHLSSATLQKRFGEGLSPLAQHLWPVSAALFALTIAALVVVIFIRPEDLLRWMPTGKVWASYRIGRVGETVFAVELAERLAQVRAFHLIYETHEAPLATRLREELIKSGGEPVLPGTDGATGVLLLTNRTRRAWLERLPTQLPQKLLTVVGTPLRLPDSFRWLWRRQWIDFRRWNARRTDRTRGLPTVPEALSRARLPAAAERAQHILCALAAVLFEGVHTIAPGEAAKMAPSTASELLDFAGIIAVAAWLVPAWLLRRRRVSEPLFFRMVTIAWPITLLFGGAILVQLAKLKGDYLRIIPAAIFLLAAPWWLRRQRPALSFWFPQPNVARADDLSPPRQWETLLWFAVYALAWQALLNPEG